MTEKLIIGENFSAILTKNKEQCKNAEDHIWDDETLFTFHNDERALRQSDINKLQKDEQEALNIASGEVTCSVCGIGYTDYDNPMYHEF